MDPNALWRKRFAQYRNESIRYWKDVGNSGFVLFAVLAVIVFSYEYGIILRRLPTNFPYLWAVGIVLAPRLVLGSVRTLLRGPDRVFLPRLEARMPAYFGRAFLYSLLLQCFWTAVLLIAVWPLYVRCAGGAQPFGIILMLVLLLKSANLLADWQENRMVDRRVRRWSFWLRWAATVGLVTVLFSRGSLAAGAGMLAGIGLWSWYSRRVRKHTIHWDLLLEKEKEQQRRLYVFFSWFTEVPQLPKSVKRRWLLTMAARGIRYRQSNSFLYLYAKTWLRSELSGMLIRMTIVGMIVIYAVSGDLAKTTALLLVPLIGAVQLTSLAQAHKHTSWVRLYPLRPEEQSPAVETIAAILPLAQVTLLSIPYLLRCSPAHAAVPLFAFAAIGIIVFLRIRPKIRALFQAE
jgi:ABC-2 type transport system permease protein